MVWPPARVRTARRSAARCARSSRTTSNGWRYADDRRVARLVGVVADPLPRVRAVTLHAEPLVWTLRLYDEPGGYAQRLPYRAVATVTLMGRKAWISGLHGKFDRAAWRAVEAWLRGQGVTSAAMERRGRMVVLMDDGGRTCST